MRKKAFTLAIAMCFCIVSHCTLTAIAMTDIQPFYISTGNITATLSIDSNGNAACSGQVTAMSSSSKTSITVKLVKKSGSTWSEVKKWTSSGSGITGASAGGSVKVAKGYTYRVEVTGKVYNSSGTLLETTTKNSAEKAY